MIAFDFFTERGEEKREGGGGEVIKLGIQIYSFSH